MSISLKIVFKKFIKIAKVTTYVLLSLKCLVCTPFKGNNDLNLVIKARMKNDANFIFENKLFCPTNLSGKTSAQGLAESKQNLLVLYLIFGHQLIAPSGALHVFRLQFCAIRH